MSSGDGGSPAVEAFEDEGALPEADCVSAEEAGADSAREALNGRYELRGLIGRGGMAEVHRGFDRVLRRDVAVKIMHSTLAETAERDRFTAETRLLASLNDPHLVTLLDAGVQEAGPLLRPWFVMELVSGPSLARRLLDGPLDEPEAARVGAGLAEALVHVHARDIVHRDVKPANVLLTASGAAKLADFGVARAVGADHTLTQTGHVIGTAAYLAPEQVTGAPVTGASDVYALGLLLLEALTGLRAYTGTPQEMAFARLHHSPAIPVSLGARWTRLLAQMTAFNPADRPDAAEVAERLRAFGGRSDRGTTGVAPPAVPAATPQGLTRDTKGRSQSPRTPVVIKAAASLAAAVLVAGVLAWLTHPTAGSTPSAWSAGVTRSTKSAVSTPRSDGSTHTLRSTPDSPAAHAPAGVAVAVPHHPIRHRRPQVGHPRPQGHQPSAAGHTAHAPPRPAHHRHRHGHGPGHGPGHGRGHRHPRPR